MKTNMRIKSGMFLKKLRDIFMEPISEGELWTRHGVATKTIFLEEEKRRAFLARERGAVSEYETYREWKKSLVKTL